MKNTTRFFCTLGLFGLSAVAHAEGAGKAALTLNFSALNYRMTNDDVKPDGGTSTKTKKTELGTYSMDLAYAEISLGNVNFYLNPFNPFQHVVSASYMVVPDMVEVGLDLGLNSSSVDKPKKTTNDTTIGVFGWVYPKVGTMTSELGLDLRSITGKSSDETTATTVKTDVSQVKVVLTANMIVPLAKNFSYVGGINYTNNNMKDTEGKSTTTTGEFDVNIASVRLTLD